MWTATALTLPYRVGTVIRSSRGARQSQFKQQQVSDGSNQATQIPTTQKLKVSDGSNQATQIPTTQKLTTTSSFYIDTYQLRCT